ncbi:InlB B-repeat-containing protein [Persicobacter psychrovividus]|uniref:T9SS type A sorting domain-containing protein n=1 Tax=Persicobacter psychrovividus TaxID=387638 RepID=A0ABN6LF96_9BACT|nr:hypothetical protein PEPS_41210 [Persicobacter psychrovividus]
MKFKFYCGLLMATFWSVISFAQTMPVNGDGSEANPYLIENLEHLKWLSLGTVGEEPSTERFDLHYSLMADIDCSEWDDFSPIGGSYYFRGSFRGNGYTISNIHYDGPGSFAAFFYGLNGAKVDQLGLTGLDINVLGNAGGLVGYMGSTSTISECFTTGRISGTNVGGLIAVSNGVVSNCYSGAEVICVSSESWQNGGGLIGKFSSGSLMQSYAFGPVSNASGTENINALIGGFTISLSGLSGSVSQCYFDAETAGVGQAEEVDGFPIRGITGRTTSEFLDENNIFGIGIGTTWDYGNLPEVDTNQRPYFMWQLYEMAVAVTSEPVSGAAVLSGGGGYNLNDQVTLSATSSRGYQFVQWEDAHGTVISTDAAYNFTLSAMSSTKYTAVFEEQQGPLFSGGDGSYEDPFEIRTLSELAYMANLEGNYQKYFILMADIDASATADWNGGLGFSPAGHPDKPFKGVLHGNKHVISGLTINRPKASNVGLFGYIDGASVDYLCLKDVAINGGDGTGALVGTSSVYSNGEIHQVVVSGSVAGNDAVGGIVGRSQGSSSTMDHVFSSASVNARGTNVGGIAGIEEGTITFALATGEVNGLNAGGIAGEGGGNIRLSYWDKTTTGQEFSAGSEESFGLETSDFESEEQFNFFNFDAQWEIQSDTDFDVNTRPLLQWLLYDGYISVEENPAVKFITGAGGVNIGDEVVLQVQPLAGYTFNAWFINDNFVTENPYTFTYQGGEIAPVEVHLRSNLNLAGAGTEASPYLISDVEDLAQLSYHTTQYSNSYFELTQDIDATETAQWHLGDGFKPIQNWNSKLDGKGYTITGLHINLPEGENVGLFTEAFGFDPMNEVPSSVKNLTLSQVNILGKKNVGGIFGKNEFGEIMHCHIDGLIQGYENVGGIAGTHGHTVFAMAKLESCSFSGEILGVNVEDGEFDGPNKIGGIAGHNDSPISRCFMNGTIGNAMNLVGGIVGEMGATVSYCFVTGTVGNDYSASYVGGIAGDAASGGGIGPWIDILPPGPIDPDPIYIENCWVSGKVYGKAVGSGTDGAGGLFAGSDLEVTKNSYFDFQTVGVYANAGIDSVSFGLPTVAFAQGATDTTFVDWDFENDWFLAQIPAMDLNIRPYLKGLIHAHEITISSDQNGAINTAELLNPTKLSVIEGGSITFSIEPKADYRIASLMIDGVEVAVQTSYTFSEVMSAHSIAATFEKITYELTVEKEGPGLLMIGGEELTEDMLEVEIKREITFEFQAAEKSELAAVYFNEVEIPEEDLNISQGVYSWKTPRITDNATFKVVFEEVILSNEAAQVGHVYPNPTSGKLTITELAAGVEVQVFSPSGALIYQLTASGSEMQLNLAHCPSGIYHVVIAGDKSFKLIKK